MRYLEQASVHAGTSTTNLAVCCLFFDRPDSESLRVLVLLALGWARFVTSSVFSSFRGSQRF